MIITVEQKIFKKMDAVQAAKIISSGERWLILGHKNPDGDTIGSAAALREIIRAAGRQAFCASAEPIPDRLLFITKDEPFIYPFSCDDAADFDHIVTVDVASPEQLGNLSPISDKVSLMIDHHSKGKIYAPYYIIPDEAAAGKLIWNIALALKKENILDITPAMCRSIYAAIVSDTGGFKYSSVTPGLLRASADIIEIILDSDDGGMPPDEIFRLLFDCKTEKEIAASRIAYEKLSVLSDGKLAICAISLEDMIKGGLGISDFSNIIEIPRTIDGVKIAVAIKESEKDVWRISARANGDYDISIICGEFEGGGHVRAAGGILRESDEKKAVQKITEAFSKIL